MSDEYTLERSGSRMMKYVSVLVFGLIFGALGGGVITWNMFDASYSPTTTREETYTMSDTRRVSCIVVYQRSHVISRSCDWVHADGSDRME